MLRTVLFSFAVAGAQAQMAQLNAMLDKLDMSHDGQCHQISGFRNVEAMMNNPGVKAAASSGGMMNSAMITMAEGVVTNTINGRLGPLEKNTELVDSCKDIIATDNKVTGCLQVQASDQMAVAMNNQTLVDQMTKGDATKAAMMKKMAAAIADMAAPVKADAAQMEFCKSSVDAKCYMEKGLARFVEIAKDDAAVTAHFNNNATTIAKFKDGAAKAQTRLDAMKADTALAAVCEKMPYILPIDFNNITLADIPTTMPTPPAGVAA